MILQQDADPFTVAMQRTAIRDTKLPDGSILPKGQRCAVDSYGPSGMADSEHYENPGEFDPYRFARMRGQPGLDAKSHLVSTGPGTPRVRPRPALLPWAFLFVERDQSRAVSSTHQL